MPRHKCRASRSSVLILDYLLGIDYLLGTYNLVGTVYFPTRTTNNSATLIDNIFIDNRRNYSIKPCINGLSDHDAQLITLSNFTLPISISEPNTLETLIKTP
jgi:hypothetical protein